MMGVSRTIPWMYSRSAQYYHGRAWRLVKDYRRRTTDVAEKKKTKDVQRNMQKSVALSALNVARTFKIIT